MQHIKVVLSVLLLFVANQFVVLLLLLLLVYFYCHHCCCCRCSHKSSVQFQGRYRPLTAVWLFPSRNCWSCLVLQEKLTGPVSQPASQLASKLTAVAVVQFIRCRVYIYCCNCFSVVYQRFITLTFCQFDCFWFLKLAFDFCCPALFEDDFRLNMPDLGWWLAGSNVVRSIVAGRLNVPQPK